MYSYQTKSRTRGGKKETRQYRRFGHLAQTYRERKEKERRESFQNKFEVLLNRVMNYGVKEVRRQIVEKREVQCFRYWRVGHVM